ncbi:unnamed protein product [Rotaria socialis]|uniref:NHL repeat containing protein n=1 Tax=Rotaria socialis TaxID=392032 RepID=A0A820YWD0_9BILA|nr:unnamed protein product [Rotaria socialis]
MIATLRQLQRETQHHHQFHRQHLSALSVRQPGPLLQLNVTLIIHNFPITKYPHLADSSSATTFISTVSVPLVAQCRAATCSNFTACSSSNPNCFCYSVATGGGICGVSMSCAGLLPCNNSTLTCNNSQSVCIVNTCCIKPVCFPLVSASNSVCPTGYQNSTVSSTVVTSITTSSFTPSTVVNSSYSSTWTTNSQTFARISGGVANYYYQAIRVIVNTSGNYNITSSSNVDTYGYLYATAFYPSNISLNLIAQDDDSGGSLQFEFGRFFNSSVVYILVATTYSGGVMAPFSIIVSGPSRVSLLYINTTSVTPMNSTTATIASTTQGTTPLQTPAVAMNSSCLVWNQNPIAVAGNGTAGNNTRSLNGPWDLSIDTNLNLYVSDGGNNRIIKFSSGNLVGIPLISRVGNGLSQVSNPSGSIMDANGNLYISDMFNYRIMKYANISSASQSIIGQVVAGGSFGFNYNQQWISWGVAVDALGNVFVSDYGNNRVMKWAPRSTNGTLVAGIGNGTAGNGTNQLSCPLGIYIDQSMALYIADACNGRIQKWLSGASTGTTVGGANGQLGFPTDVSVDNYGTIYAWSAGGLYRFYPGSTSGTIVISSYTVCFGFKFDSVGNVYIADYESNVISKYTVNSTSCGTRMASISVASSKVASMAVPIGKRVLFIFFADHRAIVEAAILKTRS